MIFNLEVFFIFELWLLFFLVFLCFMLDNRYEEFLFCGVFIRDDSYILVYFGVF